MDDLDQVIAQVLSADFPNKTIRGKKIVMEHTLVSPSDYLTEMFNPSFEFGTNSPHFNNREIIIRKG